MKKLGKKIILGILGALLVLIVIFIIFVGILYAKDVNPDRPAKIDNKTGFVQTYGRNIYDENGNILQLKGVNLGNWFVQEPWMAVSSVGNYDTGSYCDVRGIAAMKDNPNLSDRQIEELRRLYIDTYIQEADFRNIAELGLNCVRINFTYLNFTTDGKTFRDNAFDKLDWALNMCERYGLYAILDLHGAIGSQNMDHHSGDDAHWDLYNNPENRAMTIALWKTIAERYKERSIVAGYDLLNEPRSAPGKYTGKVQFDFYDELYKAVRSVDPWHILIMECFTFPTHGVSEKIYGWENVVYSYHIYNLTPFPQSVCLGFYKILHNLMDYDVPVYIGEWNCWGKVEDWNESIDFFDEQGWSYSSWTYKTNNYIYSQWNEKRSENWGIFELNMKPIDLSTATYDEIVEVYSRVGTENAVKTVVFDIYKDRFSK